MLLFDQLPRNLYRGTARAYAFDRLARAIALEALRRGWNAGLTPVERQFLAMPLMHSEAIADQARSLGYYARLGARYGWPYAVSHTAWSLASDASRTATPRSDARVPRQSGGLSSPGSAGEVG